MPSATTASRRSSRAASRATCTARPTASSPRARAAWPTRSPRSASASATASPRWHGTATATWSCTTRCRGSGAVLHTLNPRLHPDQVVWIADHAEDQVLFFDLTFLPLIEAIAVAREDDQGLRRDDRPRPHARRRAGKVPEPAVLRGADRRRERRVRLARVRREHGVVAVLHVGHDRQPEGRAVQPPLDDAAHLRGGAARCA